ncbi:MAG: DNA polymerase III subunit gamma/tau [Gammaproteobacteria bacterium]|nr:DNA polymerase III subunit gamma/tau [Gammaproteobacteria bacterium]
MTYQVLARKWRPRSFTALVGQEHVRRVLVNALDNDRLHHAFLFTGTRGVGKTTLARILAKALNCEAGVSSTPCGECTSCREIDEGRFVDLIEVDAASRTKVEDTRELLENVQYAPTRGRYKVYLIDEVHMLSTHSFNALLKTLEEPPPHVKFLLATTDPQRLPVTILSRCLQFNLKRLPASLIAAHLAYIMEQEGISAESSALPPLARAADGSMRDALSLLDQAIAFGGGRVRAEDVRAMLGTIEQDHVHALLEALAKGNAQALLERVERLAEQAADFAGVLEDLMSLLHRVALAQAVPDAVDDSLGDRERVLALAASLAPEDVQLYYQIGLIGRRDLPLAPDPRSGFEMVVLRMLAFRPAEDAHAKSAQPAVPTAGEAPAVPRRVRQEAGTPAAGVRSTFHEAPLSSQPPSENWSAVVEALDLKGVARELAANCALRRRDGNAVHLVLDKAHAQLRSQNAEQRLKQALQHHYGAPVQLVFHDGEPEADTPARQRARQESESQQAAEQAIAQDGVVKALCETFSARVRPDSIEPIE